eukprot:TRINITY_DN2562_c0_g5_i2.p1 TRINITY_DN2562_c0_g5~~TRINITY_DN2562_c0_g5_i2.p1  ORF type:complete len:218 (+),score=43.43 TRINITY_DN2562_c0_g5_i2:40-693(+)
MKQVLHMIDANFGVAPAVLVDSLRAAFVGFKPSATELFNALGLVHQDVIRAALVQSIELRDNAARRGVIQRDKYVEVWQHPSQVLRNALSRLLSKKQSVTRQLAVNRLDAAHLFLTTDLDTAAGLLLTFYKGNRHAGADFQVLYKLLQQAPKHKSKTTHLLEKVRMVLTGKYCGVTVLNQANGWVLSPLNRRKFARALTGLISDEQKQALYHRGICP